MRHLRHLLDRPAQRGQTLVLFALMSLTLMAGMGLVIDAGVNYSQRRNMQNAADTAALAGARIISRVNSFPYPATRRDTVWNEVKQVAIANGVADNPALFQCEFVDTKSDPMGVSCNTAVDGNGNQPIPPYAAGVRVRVSETHGTFFIRAVGIASSSTSAASKAQIRAMVFMPTNDVLFAVCGVETATRGLVPLNALGKDSILDTEQEENLDVPRVPPAYDPIYRTIATKGTTQIREAAYKFDWNRRDASGNMIPDWDGSAAPTYQIYSPVVAQCDRPEGTPTWMGAIVQNSRRDIQMNPQGSTVRAPRVAIKAGTLGTNTLNHAINGTLGCKVGQLPTQLPPTVLEPRMANLGTDGCVMILPIVDNSENNYTIDTNERRGRVWGVFYVFNYGGYYYGWLIKNYPVHEDGQDTWNQQYTGPITIALTKVE